jgi:hypothetical protein
MTTRGWRIVLLMAKPPASIILRSSVAKCFEGSHTLMEADLSSCLSDLYFRVWCMQHQGALIVKSQLARLDNHYSQLATITNTWRSIGVALRVFATWKELDVLEGTQTALAACKKLPPRALTGRWGTVHAAEAYLLNAGHGKQMADTHPTGRGRLEATRGWVYSEICSSKTWD